jgi:hypothetical protein
MRPLAAAALPVLFVGAASAQDAQRTIDVVRTIGFSHRVAKAMPGIGFMTTSLGARNAARGG